MCGLTQNEKGSKTKNNKNNYRKVKIIIILKEMKENRAGWFGTALPEVVKKITLYSGRSGKYYDFMFHML